MKNFKFETPKDKLEFVIYLCNLFLYCIVLCVFIGFLFILIFSFVYDLTNYIFSCIMSLVICSSLFYGLYKNKKLQEIRKKFNNLLFKRGKN